MEVYPSGGLDVDIRGWDMDIGMEVRTLGARDGHTRGDGLWDHLRVHLPTLTLVESCLCFLHQILQHQEVDRPHKF